MHRDVRIAHYGEKQLNVWLRRYAPGTAKVEIDLGSPAPKHVSCGLTGDGAGHDWSKVCHMLVVICVGRDG